MGGSRPRHWPHLAVQVEEQVASVDEVQHQVQLAGALEAVAQRDDVGVHHGREQVTLRPHVVAVVPLQDALLAHHLHGKHLAAGARTHLEDLQQQQQRMSSQHMMSQRCYRYQEEQLTQAQHCLKATCNSCCSKCMQHVVRC